MIRKKTGLVVDPYFSGSKVRWLLENVSGYFFWGSELQKNPLHQQKKKFQRIRGHEVQNYEFLRKINGTRSYTTQYMAEETGESSGYV